MKDKTFTFIGGGNMATALFAGLLANDIDAHSITIIEPSPEKRMALTNLYHVNTAPEATPAHLNSHYIFLCVKPQVMQSVCTDLANKLNRSEVNSNATIISVAAGITTQNLAQWLNTNNPIIRCMPNTPALLGLGATGLFSDNNLSEQEQNDITTIFSSIGISIWVDNENDIDTVTAVSGSGPAYFFRMIEAMQSAAVELGLNAEDAGRLITQTALGAAQMAKDSHLSIQQLRENVTSKGGTTAAALNTMSEQGFDSVIKHAINAARQRSIELAES